MNIFRLAVPVFLITILPVFSVLAAEQKQVNSTVSYSHVLNWSLGLIAVLVLFFACVWLVKKTGTLSGNNKQEMRVVSGLSLGMREKLILVQLGDRQVVLGVTPGKIEKILVLEPEDTLFKQSQVERSGEEFSQKLKQVLSGKENE